MYLSEHGCNGAAELEGCIATGSARRASGPPRVSSIATGHGQTCGLPPVSRIATGLGELNGGTLLYGKAGRGINTYPQNESLQKNDNNVQNIF